MSFIWTIPDPLDKNAETRSIYVTELQAAVNTRRAEIGQIPLSFIDQGVGTIFRLDAIEELKTVTEQLVSDFGYVLGIYDPTLLGRDWVEITKKFGAYVCHYPILNDLRIVLNNLVVPVGDIYYHLFWGDSFGDAYNRLYFSKLYDIPTATVDILGYHDSGLNLKYNKFTIDDTYGYAYPFSTNVLTKYNLSDMSITTTGDNINPLWMRPDKNYLWVGTSNMLKVNKNTLNLISTHPRDTSNQYISLTERYLPNLSTRIYPDNVNLWVGNNAFSQQYRGDHPSLPIGWYRFDDYLLIRAYNKSTFVFTDYYIPPIFNLPIILPWPQAIWPYRYEVRNITGSVLAMDNTYLYVRYSEQVINIAPGGGAPVYGDRREAILRITKGSTAYTILWQGNIEMDGQRYLDVTTAQVDYPGCLDDTYLYFKFRAISGQTMPTFRVVRKASGIVVMDTSVLESLYPTKYVGGVQMLSKKDYELANP